MAHKISGMRCLVAHLDENSHLQPACYKCLKCGSWIRPEAMKLTCPADDPDSSIPNLMVDNQ